MKGEEREGKGRQGTARQGKERNGQGKRTKRGKTEGRMGRMLQLGAFVSLWEGLGRGGGGLYLGIGKGMGGRVGWMGGNASHKEYRYRYGDFRLGYSGIAWG